MAHGERAARGRDGGGDEGHPTDLHGGGRDIWCEVERRCTGSMRLHVESQNLAPMASTSSRVMTDRRTAYSQRHDVTFCSDGIAEKREGQGGRGRDGGKQERERKGSSVVRGYLRDKPRLTTENNENCYCGRLL